MGTVIFLNEQAKKFHEEQGIKIVNPPKLKLVVDNDSLKPQNKRKLKKKASGRKTLGQRIYEQSLINRGEFDPNEPA